MHTYHFSVMRCSPQDRILLVAAVSQIPTLSGPGILSYILDFSRTTHLSHMCSSLSSGFAMPLYPTEAQDLLRAYPLFD